MLWKRSTGPPKMQRTTSQQLPSHSGTSQAAPFRLGSQHDQAGGHKQASSSSQPATDSQGRVAPPMAGGAATGQDMKPDGVAGAQLPSMQSQAGHGPSKMDRASESKPAPASATPLDAAIPQVIHALLAKLRMHHFWCLVHTPVFRCSGIVRMLLLGECPITLTGHHRRPGTLRWARYGVHVQLDAQLGKVLWTCLPTARMLCIPQARLIRAFTAGQKNFFCSLPSQAIIRTILQWFELLQSTMDECRSIQCRNVYMSSMLRGTDRSCVAQQSGDESMTADSKKSSGVLPGGSAQAWHRRSGQQASTSGGVSSMRGSDDLLRRIGREEDHRAPVGVWPPLWYRGGQPHGPASASLHAAQ